MHRPLALGLSLTVLLSACASHDPKDASAAEGGPPRFELVAGDEESRIRMLSSPLPFVAVTEADVAEELRGRGMFKDFRIVPKRPDRTLTGLSWGSQVVINPEGTAFGRATPTPANALRPGELLIELAVSPRYEKNAFDATFELSVQDRTGTIGVAHTLHTRCEQRGGFYSEGELLVAVGAGLELARTRAVQTLIQRLLADSLTMEALRSHRPGAAQPPAAPAPRPAAKLPAPRAVTGRTFVLAVGVDDYADPAITDLRSAENDAHDLAAFYALHRRSPAGPERVVTLAGKAATRTAVLQAVREHLGQATEPDDAVVLFFAGHGFSDANDAYLAPQDAELGKLPETAIALSALQTYWARLGAASKLLLVDACHAGALAGLRGVGGIARPKADPAATRPLGESTVVVAGSSAEQLSAEHAPHARGVFTTALLHGLSGDADQDGDRVITLAELRAFLEAEVPRRARIAGARQTPVVVGPAGSDGMALTR